MYSIKVTLIDGSEQNFATMSGDLEAAARCLQPFAELRSVSRAEVVCTQQNAAA
jgi:hypothetical protein